MSQTPQKLGQKMCKSPKTSSNQFHIKPDKIDYENLSTNCTVVGSNNLNLVKKPQIVTSMSPAYSNPSPGYPPSPYSSPASLKSPSPSLKPPTPQPPTFPVMQIINSHMLARPMQNQAQNIIKLKPHLNILPKPSASPQPSPKPSVSPQIVIPNQQATATIMPTAQPVLLNQMPLLTTPSVQFILRPQTTKLPAQMQSTPQGLILQPGGQQLLQIQPQRTQPMVRVLTNGMQLTPAATTAYVTQMSNPTTQNVVINNAPSQQQSPNSPQKQKKAKNKVKKKLDLANIMKLSGIGDEDDIQFESDASQSESEPNPPQHQQQQHYQQQQQQNFEAAKKLGNIQLTHHQPVGTPVVQVLNHQNFQSGLISNSAQHQPFNPFITPNFTINNGLMVQRTGGFKLTLAEDGRLVLQHDPTLNQDLQSQLFLQSVLGLNGGLVLQPSIDQQTTVQTIQQQTIQQSQTIQHQTVQQTIQHQTVQSQPIMQQPMQIVQPHLHAIQTQIQGQLQSMLQHQQHQAVQTHQIPPAVSPLQHQQQHQPVLKVQPFQKTQPPVQTVHPQPQQQQQQQQQENHQQPQQQPTSYVVNLTPDQLEQLKRNGQLTVNGQTIFMQRPNSAGGGNNNNAHKQQEECNNIKKLSPKIKPVNKKVHKVQQQQVKNFTPDDSIKEVKSSLITALQAPPKHISQPVPQQKQAIVQPSVKEKVAPKSPAQTPQQIQPPKTAAATPTTEGTNSIPPSKNQRIHTIQLTPQKQEHLKNIQMQIQTLSASLTPGNGEIQAALKMLFAEQQKILATGKLLPPDKVYYHNNHLTIINPSSLANMTAKTEVQQSQPQTTARSQTEPAHQVITTQSHPVPRISVSIPATVEHATPQPVVHTPSHVTTPGPRLSVPPNPQQVAQQQHLNNLKQQQITQQQQQQAIAKKAHLVDVQLNLDQAGAVKPDIHSPFRDKKDACIRLIRYHCFDQPVLSQKDLAKADEIFEMTAKHFIGKYGKMVDKYNFLLMKESMRQVQTSELMMLDRMYLSEERQSLMRLRQDAEEAAQMADLACVPPVEPGPSHVSQEDYDEWACIQRELGCLPPPEGSNAHKRTASSDSRLETLKRFRVDKHQKRHNSGDGGGGVSGGGMIHNNAQMLDDCCYVDEVAHSSVSGDDNEVENNSIDEQVQSAIDSILNLQQSTGALDLDSILS